MISTLDTTPAREMSGVLKGVPDRHEGRGGRGRVHGHAAGAAVWRKEGMMRGCIVTTEKQRGNPQTKET